MFLPLTIDNLYISYKTAILKKCNENLYNFRAFNNFLSAAPDYDFPAYKQRVADITISFKRISEEVIHIKTSLNDTHNRAEISGLIEKIQELEEKKLKQVIQDFKFVYQQVCRLTILFDGLMQETCVQQFLKTFF